ncbi:hypothetical protein ACJJIU_18010 [Microbulbifer sp. CnH-101-E]|uniref:hypothetical protein n=1 Tax=unclassified Microbulbifer TaxID=2619833 RepID=UPI00403A076F
MHKKIKTENKKINSKYRKNKKPNRIFTRNTPAEKSNSVKANEKSAGSKKLRGAFPPINEALS